MKKNKYNKRKKKKRRIRMVVIIWDLDKTIRAIRPRIIILVKFVKLLKRIKRKFKKVQSETFLILKSFFELWLNRSVTVINKIKDKVRHKLCLILNELYPNVHFDSWEKIADAVKFYIHSNILIAGCICLTRAFLIKYLSTQQKLTYLGLSLGMLYLYCPFVYFLLKKLVSDNTDNTAIVIRCLYILPIYLAVYSFVQQMVSLDFAFRELFLMMIYNSHDLFTLTEKKYLYISIFYWISLVCIKRYIYSMLLWKISKKTNLWIYVPYLPICLIYVPYLPICLIRVLLTLILIKLIKK